MAGHFPFILGTYNSGHDGLTTPPLAEIQKQMALHEERMGTHFILEVTSEGIAEGRVSGLPFDVKVLTNITRDHLDYHGSFKKYSDTKMNFMNRGSSYRLMPSDFLSVNIWFETMLLGDFNRENIKAAVAVLRYLGVDDRVIASSISRTPSPPGRLEEIHAGQPFRLFVDYAHTPDGMKAMLTALRSLAATTSGRLLCLFGCGGGRDKGKRFKMGSIGSGLADYLVVTSDNPRNEEPESIIREIVRGVSMPADSFHVVVDRRVAINEIVALAEPGDVVVIAGRGHEQAQETAGTFLLLDDKKEAADAVGRAANSNKGKK